MHNCDFVGSKRDFGQLSNAFICKVISKVFKLCLDLNFQIKPRQKRNRCLSHKTVLEKQVLVAFYALILFVLVLFQTYCIVLHNDCDVIFSFVWWVFGVGDDDEKMTLSKIWSSPCPKKESVTGIITIIATLMLWKKVCRITTKLLKKLYNPL